jgi:hypothetical protein
VSNAKQDNGINIMKIISITCIIILVANILLVSFKVYDALIMGGIIVIIAIIAFPGMKMLKKINNRAKTGTKK